MTIFDATEKVKFLARQSLHYDRYAGCNYCLERVDVNGKCGLVYLEETDQGGTRARILLEPIYNDIKVDKISSPKAMYDEFTVYADGNRIGQFTLVLNAWVLN
ncbi:MAG TPA: hypothetical protein VK900_02780 [Anaerolineales bacterium]|nr:hypothetical protein [Anaerolineales bacterium]